MEDSAAAGMRLATSARAGPPVTNLREVKPAWVVVVVVEALQCAEAVVVAERQPAAVVAASVVAAAAVVVAVAAGARISGSSTISFCSATCRTALATIGSATMAATALTWA